MKLSRKQKEFLDLVEDETITEICFGGQAGGGKSSSICLALLVLARQYPGYKAAVCRKTMPALKLTTWEELKTTCRREGLIEREDRYTENWDYRVDSISNQFMFKNGSKILFLSLDLRGDEDLQRLGSTNIDDILIDEAGEIAFEAYSVAKSRVGRGPAAIMYHRPGKIILTCNPSQNFLREQFYDPYDKLGGGEFQKWKIGDTVNSKGEKIEGYRSFLRSTCFDNPFLPDAYIENLKALPIKQRKRLFEGDWNYSDDENALFTSECIANSIIYEIPENPKDESGKEIFDKFIGVDVSDKGGDKTVVSLIDNNILIAQEELTANKDAIIPVARQYADQLEAFALKYGFNRNDARRIAIEANGVGVGLVSQMQTKGWRITEYTATSKNRSNYLYQLARNLEDGQLRIYYKIKTYEQLRLQLSAHEVNYDGQEPKVMPKDKVRAKINRSPDNSDSFYIANYVRLQTKEFGSHARRFRTVNI